MNSLVFDGKQIRTDSEFLNLTDMWKSAGSDPSKRPALWMQTEQARDFAEFVAENLNVANGYNELFRIVRGGKSPATWAHWQVGLAYAKYLSPAFHAWANQAVRDYMSGTLQPLPASRFERMLVEKSRMWERVWEVELRNELLRIWCCRWEEAGWPPFFNYSIVPYIYNCVVGQESMDEARKRCRADSTERSRTKLHQWFTEEALELFKSEIGVVLALAKASSTPAAFYSNMQKTYGKEFVQLQDGLLSQHMEQEALFEPRCKNKRCGMALLANAPFCHHCGTKVKKQLRA